MYLTREAAFPEGMSGQRSQEYPDYTRLLWKKYLRSAGVWRILIASSWFLFFGFVYLFLSTLKIVSRVFPFYVRFTITNRIRLFKAAGWTIYTSQVIFLRKATGKLSVPSFATFQLQKKWSPGYAKMESCFHVLRRNFPIFILNMQFSIQCISRARNCVLTCMSFKESVQ